MYIDNKWRKNSNPVRCDHSRTGPVAGPVGRGRCQPRGHGEHERLLETPLAHPLHGLPHGTGQPLPDQATAGTKDGRARRRVDSDPPGKGARQGKLRAGRDTIRVAAVRETTAPSQPADRTRREPDGQPDAGL